MAIRELRPHVIVDNTMSAAIMGTIAGASSGSIHREPAQPFTPTSTTRTDWWLILGSGFLGVCVGGLGMLAAVMWWLS